MNRRALTLGAGALLAVVALATWSMSRQDAPPPAAAPAAAARKPQPVMRVSVVDAVQRSIADEIRVTGVLVPREIVKVVSEVAGLRVRAIPVETGDRVRRGQTVALLDAESLSIDSQSLQAEYERTRDEYERIREMLAIGIVSKEFGRQRLAAFEVARARLEVARLNVRRAQIVSPVDGLVYERTATVGDLSSASEPLMRIARDARVEMEAAVPEALVLRLRPGMPVKLTLAGESTPVAGTVRQIMPVVDATKRSTAVRIRFDRERPAPVGVFCEAAIEVEQISGWVLPASAVQQDAQGLYVWQVGPDLAVARRAVTVAMRTADSVVVKEALAGVPIVAKAGAFLKDGDLVAIDRE